MKVGEWIKERPGCAVSVGPDCPLPELVDLFLEHPALRDIFVVSGDGSVLGHLSYGRVARRFLIDLHPVHTRRQLMERVTGGTAREIMETHFVHAESDEELEQVVHRQLDGDVEDMPVLDDQGALVGAINLRTVLRRTREANG